MTVDCQNPGWLSSMINYGDQLTLKNIKVTGFINGTDIQFIYDLNSNRSLTGVIDFEDVSIVSGGTLNNYPYTVKNDNEMPYNFFYNQKQNIQKFIYPKTLVKCPLSSFIKTTVDSLIWTSTNVNSLDISNGIGKSEYVFIPEGVETIDCIGENTKIIFPSTIKNITGSGDRNTNLVIYSFIDNPEEVTAQYEYYYNTLDGEHRSYWASILNSTFYIPKGSMEKYLNSDFAKMNKFNKSSNGIIYGTSNENIFIEYYDVENTEIAAPFIIYKGESHPTNVIIHPDANLVSWIDYSSSNSDIVSVDSQGNILAKDYGQAEISATPHVFIDGLETKTGTCIVKVIAHTEGVDVPSAMNVHIGEEKALNAKTLPLDLSDNELLYESSDPSIASVNSEGIIIGNSRGTCNITVTSVDGGFTADCLVTVLKPVETVILEKHNVTLKVGDTDQLFAQITPATADNKVIEWSSSDEEVVSVDVSGNIVALKSGEAWVKAVSNDNAAAKDSCKVTVTQSVSGITLAQDSYTLLSLDETVQIEATVLPADATNKEIRWSSSNENVCVVNDGKVTPTGYGMAIVMASTIEGGYSASCIVKVLEMGDANGDCVIDKADAEEVAYYILGRPSSKFIFVLADVNEDKKISILDAVGIINIAIMKSTASARLKALDEQ